MTRPVKAFWLLCYYSCIVIFPLCYSVPAVTEESTTIDSGKNEPLWNDTWEDKLKHNLLANYDKFARPAHHHKKTTVDVSLVIFSVSVDDMTNVMAANAWNTMAWTDDKLKWNSSEYGGLKQISLGSHELWLPDIYLMNSASPMEYYGDRHATLQEDGSVIWFIPTIFHGYCNLDFTYWPFESNTCRLSLSSWTYDGNQVDLKLTQNHGVYLSKYFITSEWVVKAVTSNRRVDIYECCPNEPYITLDFEFKLSRSADLYYHLVFIPTLPIMVLTLITFWLHPQSEIKLVINACTILIVIIYLMYFGTKIPPRYDSMPLIVRFYTGCLIQATLSLIVSTFLINIHKLAFYFTIPRNLRRFLMGKVGRFLCLGPTIQEINLQKSTTEQEMSEDQLMGTSISTTNLNYSQQMLTTTNLNNRTIDKLEWILVATAIDRAVFVLFNLIFIIMFFVFIRAKRFEFTSDNIPFWHN